MSVDSGVCRFPREHANLPHSTTTPPRRYNPAMPTDRVIRVSLADKPYDIRVEPGILARVGEHLAQLTKSRKAMLLSDSNVSAKFGPAIRDSLAKVGIVLDVECVIPAGEEHKTLEQI